MIANEDFLLLGTILCAPTRFDGIGHISICIYNCVCHPAGSRHPRRDNYDLESSDNGHLASYTQTFAFVQDTIRRRATSSIIIYKQCADFATVSSSAVARAVDYPSRFPQKYATHHNNYRHLSPSSSLTRG